MDHSLEAKCKLLLSIQRQNRNILILAILTGIFILQKWIVLYTRAVGKQPGNLTTADI